MPQKPTGPIAYLKILLHAAFFFSGISTVFIGQVLPILASKFGLTDQQTANFFPAQFAGSLIGTFLTNWMGKRGRFLPASFIGCFLMAAGVFLLSMGRIEYCLIGFLINGVGIGLTLPSINMLIVELSPTSVTSSLNILNFFWGFGAIVSQPFVDWLSRGDEILTPTIILAAALAAIGGAMALVPKEIEKSPSASAATDTPVETPIWTLPLAWLIAAFNFIHIGFESAIGGWLKTYTQRVEPDPASHLVQPILVYFLFFVVGRGVAPAFFRFLNDNAMLFVSLIMTFAGVVVLLFAGSSLMLSVGGAIAGFGTSSIFPTNMSRFTKTFGPTASRRATPFFICGTLGATFTTYTIGAVSSRFDSL